MVVFETGLAVAAVVAAIIIVAPPAIKLIRKYYGWAMVCLAQKKRKVN